MWMCLLDLNIWTFRSTAFFHNYLPISITFSKEKHPIWLKLGAFYNNLLKIHPMYVIWAPSSLMKTHQSLYQYRETATKRHHIFVYHVNVRTPPPRIFINTSDCLISQCPISRQQHDQLFQCTLEGTERSRV